MGKIVDNIKLHETAQSLNGNIIFEQNLRRIKSSDHIE